VAEVAFHAHPDAWALLWLIGAWIWARRERYFFAGALAGIAVSAKLFALLAVPFLACRRPFAVLLALLAVLGIIYAPLLASSSSAEWAGLHAMASYFEFNSFGYALLAHFFGSTVARPLWLILFGLIAAFLFARWAGRRRSLQEAPVADVMLAFFLLSPVLNPWYLVWLVPFAATQPTPRSVALLIVIPLSYATGLNLGDSTLATYAQPLWARPVEFGIVILAALRSVWPIKLATKKILLG
jgi:hypothetical protein